MRRRTAVLVLLLIAAALATAGTATAANGGFGPLEPHSPNAKHTETVYWVIFGFTTAIFLVVEATLIVFLVKYRARRRARLDEGDQLHGHTRLEVIWTVIPVIILAVIATTVFLLLPGISGPDAQAADRVDITVEGHMFYWQFNYPNGARTINDLYVPVDKEVRLKVVSADVVHSYWVPQLHGKIQAIPGRDNSIWFKADRTGTFYGQCALICGPFHAAMKETVHVMPEAEYTSYIDGKATQDLGRSEWNGVCAVCHGMQGEGGYGPALANNSVITQSKTLETTIRNGRNLMPPVANTWTDEQVNALVQYAKAKIYKGAASSGG